MFSSYPILGPLSRGLKELKFIAKIDSVLSFRPNCLQQVLLAAHQVIAP